MTDSSLYWIGGIGSGVFISGLSAGGMWLLENKKPTAKTVGRDFILGGILFFILLQLLPESTMNLLTSIVALVPVASVASAAATVAEGRSYENVIETLTGAASSDEVEVRVGVPRF
jgi:hypothetical protein